MKIFGDDGFRDKVEKGLLSKKFLNKFFSSLNYIFHLKKIQNVTIGYDTRQNKSYILKIIKKKINSVKKIDILDKPISTPGLHYLSKNNFGIMITASHFPYNYNGFKFFFLGEKINKDFERLLVKNLDQRNSTIKTFSILRIINLSQYIKFINKKFNFKSDEKILIDCSNGSVASFAKKINFLKNLKLINTNYKKNKINKNCGTNFLDQNIKKRIFRKHKFCVAYDGDADRFLVSEKNYGVIESEKLALIFFKFLCKKKIKQSVVATEISNPWLAETLRKEKSKVFISKVGDRNVIKTKKRSNSLFGFETSGHFCFDNTMDGLYASGLFLQILREKPHLINNVLNCRINYEKKIFGLKSNYLNDFKNFVKKLDKKNIKIILRKSIWNNFFKVYIFYKSENDELKKLLYFLKKKIIKKKFKN